MDRIASFSVDHTKIVPGVYISRTDGDITTYDLRTRKPNTGDLMTNSTMHSVEHLFATLIRNSEISGSIIYFGPMGCQTGFYLLVRGEENGKVLDIIRQTLRRAAEYQGEMPGASEMECGNYRNLSLEAARTECADYLKVLENWTAEDLRYPE